MYLCSYRILISRNTLLMYTRSQAASLANQSSNRSNGVTHVESAQEFHMKVNSDTAKVEYVRNGDVLDLTESFVPESMRGKGLGHLLAKGTFDYVENSNLKLKLTCTFLQKFYEENKDRYKHLVVE